jgi:FMN-dependent NADH-azoreductase
MKTLLQINASIFSSAGESSRLADEFVSRWRARNPRSGVMVRDLARDPVPHLDAARFRSLVSPPGERSAAQQAVLDYSDALVAELERADVIVMGLPMYNFGVPSTLKAYFDHIARAGVTFRYTANGSEGLLKGKKAYVFAARGGSYAGTALDTQSAYVRDFLRFVGIDDVEFVYAEGLNIGEAAKQAGLTAAHEAIERLSTPERLAA